jgi:single-strand DNA-binding protein
VSNAPEIVFSGNLAAPPRLGSHTPTGGAPTVVANLRVAVTPRRKARGSEEWVDGETLWFNVSAWRRLAGNCMTSFKQGDRLLVRGRLTQSTWKDAGGAERVSLEVEATDIGHDVVWHPALSTRVAGQRQAEDTDDAPTDVGEHWAGSGTVDLGTGEVLAAGEQEPVPAGA